MGSNLAHQWDRLVTNVPPTERAVTHKAYAPVARLMGYRMDGFIELCQNAVSKNDLWVCIGLTRREKLRVNARWNWDTSRYEFSVGSVFQLTENERDAERIRHEAAQAIVDGYNAARSNDMRSIVRAATIREQDQQAQNEEQAPALSRPETKIIHPVAPRDPRGI